VFWLVSQSWRTPATCVGICRWISLAAANDDPVNRPSKVSPFLAIPALIPVYVHTYRVVHIIWDHFTFERYWTALFLTTKTGKIGSRFQKSMYSADNTNKLQNQTNFCVCYKILIINTNILF